jgi:hypothetical protein
MPGLLHQGELTMGILKTGGGGAAPIPVPDFTYSSDSLAQMIVDVWVDKDYRDHLLDRTAGAVTDAAARLARISLAERGIYLQRAVVITEEEYNNDYTIPAGFPNEVVFVLPDLDRVTPQPGQSLLETARLLMATTPNGI